MGHGQLEPNVFVTNDTNTYKQKQSIKSFFYYKIISQQGKKLIVNEVLCLKVILLVNKTDVGWTFSSLRNKLTQA